LTDHCDIIGDIHGCAETLVRLLERMDYRKINGVYQHRTRRAIFVGDVLDRGPHIREALHLVRDMVEAGHAEMVMGNHEYNAIAYSTAAKAGSGRQYLREHDERHTRQIAETLDQFANHPGDWQGFLSWFSELPLFIEKPEFRVVHACWDHDLINQYTRDTGKNTVDMDFIHASVDQSSFAGRMMDRLTRGTDMALPDGRSMTSKDGYTRQFFRTRFWGDTPTTYGEVAFQPDPLPEDIANRPISAENRQRICSYHVDERPLFVGHYWLDQSPRPLAPNVACLDYSAVKYGRLAAYRMDGEHRLSQDKFVWVYVDRDQDDRDGV
jgi:diadenosine tetraphosphatase ApaH/serine/threonine PP2A family protein phosphatase